jgi:hypothetical protein
MRLALMALFLSAMACGTTRLSARGSMTPMMLGQIRYVGASFGKLQQSETPTTFVAAASDHGGLGDLRWHALDSSAAQGLALAIADLPASERNGVLAVSRITCDLRQWFAIVVSVLHSDCILQTATLTTYPEPVGPKPLP